MCRYQERKAQSAIEFMLVFVFLMAILAIATTISWIRIYGAGQAQKDLEISKVLNDVTNKVNIAYLEGHGFTINATLPEEIMKNDYEMGIEGTYLVITFDNKTYLKSMLTRNIVGNLRKGSNVITNDNSVIKIT
jgi:hypothetical protein